MLKYFTLLLVGIAGALVILYFKIGVPQIYREDIKNTRALHLYDNPKQSINEIHLTGIYFVPQDRQNNQLESWQEDLRSSLAELKQFHDLQFQGYSDLTIDIYPNPIIGRQDSIYYDTDNTNQGNPQALRNVSVEIQERVFSPEGDYWNSDDKKIVQPNAYRTVLILYEGVGASGAIGEPTALISSYYFKNENTRNKGNVFLAHEFYHTLGLPEGYAVRKIQTPYAAEIESLTSSDIMGAGRHQTLDKTYIDRQTLTHMGF